MDVYWNGVKIFEVRSTSYDLFTKKMKVKGQAGRNRLLFRGTGPSNAHGVTFSNVKGSYGTQNLIKNGDFSSPAIHNQSWKGFPSIPGWKAIGNPIIEILTGKAFNHHWPKNLQACESDAGHNIDLYQDMYL